MPLRHETSARIHHILASICVVSSIHKLSCLTWVMKNVTCMWYVYKSKPRFLFDIFELFKIKVFNFLRLSIIKNLNLNINLRKHDETQMTFRTQPQGFISDQLIRSKTIVQLHHLYVVRCYSCIQGKNVISQ